MNIRLKTICKTTVTKVTKVTKVTAAAALAGDTMEEAATVDELKV